MVTVSVDDVPFVSVVMLLEHEYWLLVSQTPVHAAKTGTANKDAITSTTIKRFLLFIFLTFFTYDTADAYVYVVDIAAKPPVVGVNWITCVIFVMPVTLYVKL